MALNRLAGVKLKAINNRRITLLPDYFKKLTVAASRALVAMGNYHPAHDKHMDLRAHFDELYRFVAQQLSDIHEHEFDPVLLSGAALTSVDLVEGQICVNVIYNYMGEKLKFALSFSNDAAPYSTKWPELLQQTGGKAGNFAQLMEMV